MKWILEAQIPSGQDLPAWLAWLSRQEIGLDVLSNIQLALADESNDHAILLRASSLLAVARPAPPGWPDKQFVRIWQGGWRTRQAPEQAGDRRKSAAACAADHIGAPFRRLGTAATEPHNLLAC